MPPTATTAALVSRTLLARKETPSCGDREKCPMPTGSQGLPIGLGVGIPILAAILICAFLHWRHLQKLKKEAEDDRDFDAASVYDEENKGFAIESSRQLPDKTGSKKGDQPPRTNYHQDFNQNDPFFDSPYILKGEGYSENYSRSLTNLSAPYSGMPPPGSSSGLLPNHSGFLASLGGDRYPSSPASSVFRAPHINSSAASLASAGADTLRKPAPTYQRQEQLPKKDVQEQDMVKQPLPPPVPRMNISRPSLSNPNSPIEPLYSHNKQFSIGSVSDSEVDSPVTEDPFDRESNIVHTPVASSHGERDTDSQHQQQSSSFQSSSHTSHDSQDSFSRVMSEQSTATTPDDSEKHDKANGYFEDKDHLDHAPTVPVPAIPDQEENDMTSPPTQFDRVRSVYKVYFDENKEKAIRETALTQEGVAETPEGNLTMASDKELPELPGDVTADSFPADLTIDTEYSTSQMRDSHHSQSSSIYDHPVAAPPVSAGYTAALARVPPGATAPLSTNRGYAPVNALMIDFAPTTPDLSAVPHQHASPVGSSSPHSNWGTPPQDGYAFNHYGHGHQPPHPPHGGGYHGGAPAEAYLPQHSTSLPRRKPPPLQLKPLQTVPTPHKLDQSDLGVTSFVPSQKRIQTPTGSAPGSPVLSQSPSVGYNPLHNPLHSMTDTEMMPSPHALRKSVSLASLDFAPPTRFGRDSSRNNSLTSQFTSGGTPIPQQRPTQVRSKMDTAMMLKPSWEMRN
ncbi:hypothetical protein B0I72DRAFT_142008 [Yarrowia lipolytica]|nr:hypothetical protein B0I72DRAFT_142008 [Yarrowia lipolytica]RDW36674.1 hypothetical protein B0I73DRAFT_136743 [Yarrowia lipolytica]